MMEERFGTVVFRQNFDSGNFGCIEKIDNNDEDLLEFKVWTRADCAGTCYENGNRTWFHFSVSGVPSPKTLKITMCNLNKQSKLYSQGMTPIFRAVPGKIKWERIRERPTYEMIDGQFHLTFLHTVLDSKTTTYFAFVYPFSYSDLQKKLNQIESRFTSQLWNLPSWNCTEEFPSDAIYYHSTTLCHTLNNLKVQLLTISSPHGMTDRRESMLTNLFPDGPSSLPRKFNGKKVYFMSSRVHPGEVPASFVLNGFLNFILRPSDPRAILLRQLFVFKIVPMLNPDGVYSGHYRTDSRGVNLNRYYINPCPKLHPSIYGAKAVVMYHHRGGRDCSCGADKTFKILKNTTEGETSENNNNNSKKITKQVQSILNNLRKDINCSDDEFQFRMEARVSEICNKMAEINQDSTQSKEKPAAVPIQLRTAAQSSTDPVDPDQNIDVRACVCGFTPTPLPCNAQTLTNGGGLPANVHPASGIEMYVDLHGHASKRGCFFYGNNLSDDKQIENILYPRLIAYNSTHFDFPGCCFTERNMYTKDKSDGLSKEGSGRVGIYKSTGIVHSYTLECNYNMGRHSNQLPAASKDDGRASPAPPASFPPKYTPESWEEVGKALAISLLDLHNINPWTRLLNTDVVNVHGLRGLMVRTSKGASNTGPGVLRRLAYATSKVSNTNTENSKPPRPKARSVKGTSSEPKPATRRTTNASRTDINKDIVDTATESDSCSRTDLVNKGERGGKLREHRRKDQDQRLGECTDSSSGGASKNDKAARKRSTLLRQTSASLAKRSDKVRKALSSDDVISVDDRQNEISVQYRSLYSGVYKLDIEEEPQTGVKKIYPTATTLITASHSTVPVLVANDKQAASLCTFVDLVDNCSSGNTLNDADDINDLAKQKVLMSPKTVTCGQPIGSNHMTQSKIPRKSGYYPALRNGQLTRRSTGRNKEWLREWHAHGDTVATGFPAIK